MTQADSIRNAIVAYAAAFAFPTFTITTGVAGVRTTSAVATIAPASCICYPVASSFVTPDRWTRDGRKQDRAEWTWELLLKFARAVDFTAFEESLLQSTLRVEISADVARQIDITLIDVQYTTPVQQQPNAGSQATFRFNAAVRPN